MLQPDKAQVEKQQVEGLLRYFRYTHQPENAAPPAPDLLIRFPDKNVGVEVTELFRPTELGQQPLQEQEAFHEKIAESAKVQYNTRQLPPVDVHFHIQPCKRKKGESNRLATGIVDAVVKHLPTGSTPCLIENNGDECGHPSEVDYIHMIRYEGLTTASFTPNSAAWGPCLGPAYLQEKIDGKSEKVPRYLKSCNKVWLLMVETRMGLARSLFLKPNLWEATYRKNGFERLFVLEGHEGYRELTCL